MDARFQILQVAGARPNFMKIAPIAAELGKVPGVFATTLVHTGQHYDDKLSHVFFEELGIPRPDVNLNVGSGSQAQQTAAIMAAFEPVLLGSRVDLVLVVGDVNSTLACALVAAKLSIPIAHVEAGLRSFDRTMPEEINRLLTDQISDLLFTTEASAEANLRREGVDPGKIHFVGNVMIDTLLAHREHARRIDAMARYGITARSYGVMTLHRPSNVDNPDRFERLLSAVEQIAQEVPILFPVHPRAHPIVVRSEVASRLADAGRLKLLEPLGYLEFVALMDRSRLVITDSGGIQEETTILGVPCLTLRENTERPVTVTHGTNLIVGTDPDRIMAGWRQIRETPSTSRIPPLWDGQAARRIVEVLRRVAGLARNR